MFLLGLASLSFIALTSAVRLPLLRSRETFNATLEKRGDTKYVFMHHIVGNTYPYTQNDWLTDIKAIQALGVDAVALNYGASSWELDQIASAYSAAESLSSPLKLFLSPDFTSHSCDLDAVIAEIQRFAGHPNQFEVNGKVMVSSFEGGCLGQDGWQTIKDRVGAYLMPFISGLEGQFGQWEVLDTWFCWGCAWPNGDIDKNMDDDNYYMSQLGSRYGTTVSPWFYTHYDYKNFIHKSDDWLYLTRWDQLMEMRDQLTFVEMISWNDFGESHYMGPVHGAWPDGTTWIDNFPHTAWYDLSRYYITAFQTGSYPSITEDVVYYWARPHPAHAQTNDPLGPPEGWDWVSDTLWAAAFLTAPGTVTLTSGSSSQTFTNVPAGVTRLSIPLAPGGISVKVERQGSTVVSANADGYQYVTSPQTYNYNVWVGAAKGGVPPPSTPPPPANPSWSLLGCFVDTDTRVLPEYSTSSSTMTTSQCTSVCDSRGFSYAATEYGIECWCGSGVGSQTPVGSGECNMPCAGDASETCGAAWRAQVYVRKAA